jgi:heat shock protein HslJ
LLISLQTCSSPEREEHNVKRFLIESYKVECQDFILQECYLLKEGDAISSLEWTYFYEKIAGFEYSPGIRYTLEVINTERNPLPQDVGRYQYRFLSQIAKEAFD